MVNVSNRVFTMSNDELYSLAISTRGWGEVRRDTHPLTLGAAWALLTPLFDQGWSITTVSRKGEHRAIMTHVANNISKEYDWTDSFIRSILIAALVTMQQENDLKHII